MLKQSVDKKKTVSLPHYTLFSTRTQMYPFREPVTAEPLRQFDIYTDPYVHGSKQFAYAALVLFWDFGLWFGLGFGLNNLPSCQVEYTFQVPSEYGGVRPAGDFSAITS